MDFARYGRLFKASCILCGFLLTGCSDRLPDNFKTSDLDVHIYPDYTNVVMPYNISPMNFVVKEEGKACVLKIEDERHETIVVSADADKKVTIPLKKWQKMLDDNKGKSITFTVYVQKPQGDWVAYNSFSNKISEEPIDPYITYRLIEPSYMSTGIIGLYQLDLRTDEQTCIINNHRMKKKVNQYREQSCVNCHTNQRNKPQNTSFYYRGAGGGLILTYEGKTYKVNTKAGDMYAGTVYTSWHPDLPFIAFSTNIIRQSFPNVGTEKVFPYDFRGDLVLYDIEKNEITNILRTWDKLESFPYWSNDGKMLYYCSSDSLMRSPEDLERIKYDLKRIPFDAATKTWGEPEMVYQASKQNLSATHPRTSPDGKFMVFALGEYSSNAYTQRIADLYIMNLANNEVRRMDEVNSSESDCYHSWSSDSHWMMFVTRRDDANYGRPYFTYIDEKGVGSKPFALPHTDPYYDLELMESYNAPEFSKAPVAKTRADYEDVIFNTETINATFGSEIVPVDSVDSYSGASRVLKY
ncbi:MAG: hypothetical protein MJZ33_05250 [Paludibacteraceae bacterium]|nr:hypothetical protein [Paludibacteraceae bacterium]